MYRDGYDEGLGGLIDVYTFVSKDVLSLTCSTDCISLIIPTLESSHGRRLPFPISPPSVERLLQIFKK